MPSALSVVRMNSMRPAFPFLFSLMLLFSALLSGCQGLGQRSDNSVAPVISENTPTLVVISLDGFRWDYLQRPEAENLRAMVADGVSAEYVIPSYPSKTFPNHTSLATGLYPVNHGIVDNKFYDKERKQLYLRGQASKDSSWISAVPIWNLARQHGLKSATYFWPESDALVGGMTPDYFLHYSGKVKSSARVEQVLDWLKMPAVSRPQLINAYISAVDDAGHHFGPDSEQTRAAIAEVDELVGELRRRIAEEVSQPVNLVVLSDHGMVEVIPEQAIDYRPLEIEESKFTVVNGGTRLMLYANEGTSEQDLAEYRQRLSQDERYRVLTEEELKALHFWGSPRVADIIAETRAPHLFVDSDKGHSLRGQHGYIFTPEMGAIFIAAGPAFKQGVTLPPFENVNIYPALAHVLGIPVPTHADGSSRIDGTLKPIEPGLVAE